MDRGAWWATVHGVTEELDMTQQLNNNKLVKCAGQEATVRTARGTDQFQVGKGVRQGCILSSSLFNLYAEYIMRNAGLNEAQAGIKISGRNINNLRYADDTTLTAESEEGLNKQSLDEGERGE